MIVRSCIHRGFVKMGQTEGRIYQELNRGEIQLDFVPLRMWNHGTWTSTNQDMSVKNVFKNVNSKLRVVDEVVVI